MTVRGANYDRSPNDHYPTPTEVTRVALRHVSFGKTVCDPCCGPQLRILRAAKKMGYKSVGDDIVHGYDFINDYFRWKNVDILTNPPYGGRSGKLAVRFVEKAIEVTRPWRGKIAMLLPVDFDSGKTRVGIFRDSPLFSRKIILLDRIRWFNNMTGSTNHAWYVWDWNARSKKPTITYARIEE